MGDLVVTPPPTLDAKSRAAFQQMLDLTPAGWYDRQGVRITDPQRWYDLHADQEYKFVAQETVGPYWVSTVWLGLDHGWYREHPSPPIIFETMVFTDDTNAETGFRDDFDQRRYSTEAEAIAGHQETCQLVRATLLDPPDDLSGEERL